MPYVPPDPKRKLPPMIRPSHARDMCDKQAHREALRAANKLLRKAKYFPKREKSDEYNPIEAESIGSHGLKPTWHGKA